MRSRGGTCRSTAHLQARLPAWPPQHSPARLAARPMDPLVPHAAPLASTPQTQALSTNVDIQLPLTRRGPI